MYGQSDVPGLCPICHLADSTGPMLTFERFPRDQPSLSCSFWLILSLTSLSIIDP